MPKVSHIRIDKNLEAEMFRQFWHSLSQLNDSVKVSSFFSDLLTDTEEIMLAKRFTVAVLLLRGKRPVDIARTLHVTYSTIGSVASWVKNAKPQTRKILQQLIDNTEWQVILDRIDELLDKLPPTVHSDWKKAGKEKWQRTMERQTRKTLR
jgi:uncharacterized protein YerC